MASILLIEDDVDTREMLGRFLSQSGFETMTAANGWEGLLALEKPVDLILLDLMLPGMDGFSFLKVVRRQQTTRTIPVVAVTALDVSEIGQKLDQLGVNEIISKGPNVFAQLKKSLGRHLDRPPEMHARAESPEPGDLIRPLLDLYLKTLSLG